MLPHKPYDFLVVGAGLFGSIFAQQAKEAGLKCLVIDERPHLGGNCYTQKKEGIHMHQYGPHLFHTSNEQVWRYINRFSSFLPYNHRTKAWAKGRLYSFPINLSTFYELWGISDPQLASQKLEQEKVKIENPKNLEQWALSQIGPTLYELFVKDYTRKQWQEDPKNLPAFIIKRLPIRLTFNDSYFNDTYQAIPEHGYTAIFEKMLEGIETRLNTNYFKSRTFLESQAHYVVFTGRIDAYFDYAEGELAYRTQSFEHQWHNSPNVQGCGVVNYCDAKVPYTRVVEHRHFDSSCQSPVSVTTYETPQVWSNDKLPYYPINTPQNQVIYKSYSERAQRLETVFFGGRLAEYKYYDMHHVIASALAKSSQWIQKAQRSLRAL